MLNKKRKLDVYRHLEFMYSTKKIGSL